MHLQSSKGDGNRSAMMLKGTQRLLITMALQLSALESKPLKHLKEQIRSDSGGECEGQSGLTS